MRSLIWKLVYIKIICFLTNKYYFEFERDSDELFVDSPVFEYALSLHLGLEESDHAVGEVLYKVNPGFRGAEYGLPHVGDLSQTC